MSVPPPAGFGGYPPHPAYGPAAGLRFSTILGDGIALLRRGFGPMALLGLGVGVVNAGITIGLYAAFATPFLVAFASLNLSGVLVNLTVAVTAATLLGWLVQAQAGAMVVHLTESVAAGRPAELADAARATRGVLTRVLVPYLLAAAGVLLAVGGVLAWFQQVVAAARTDRTTAASTVLTFLLLLLAGYLVAAVVGAVLSARWFCFLPVVALERAPGFVALGRSWRLTRDVAWTVFGVQLVTGVVLSIVNGMVGQIAAAPLGGDPGSTLGGLQDAVDQSLPAVAVSALAGSLVQAVAVPLLVVMSTVVYRARTRPVAPPAWGPQGWGPQGWGPQGGWPPPPPR
ncbi:MAG: hypothetical protein U0R79_04385 [Propionicimonas sp.]